MDHEDADRPAGESFARSVVDKAIGHRHISTLEGRNGELVLELRVHIDELEGTNAKRRDQLEGQPAINKDKFSP